MRKLSPVQSKIVDILAMENNGTYFVRKDPWRGGKWYGVDTGFCQIIMSVSGATFESMLNSKLLVDNKKDKHQPQYILNPVMRGTLITRHPEKYGDPRKRSIMDEETYPDEPVKL